MKRFLINVYTNWCGEEQDFAAYAKDAFEIELIAAEASYENFDNYPGTGFGAVLEELFDTTDSEDLTEEELNEAYKAEGDYYGYSITEWDETRDEEEWNSYTLIYDGREENERV
jgi:hypothetical protein